MNGRVITFTTLVLLDLVLEKTLLLLLAAASTLPWYTVAYHRLFQVLCLPLFLPKLKSAMLHPKSLIQLDRVLFLASSRPILLSTWLPNWLLARAASASFQKVSPRGANATLWIVMVVLVQMLIPDAQRLLPAMITIMYTHLPLEVPWNLMPISRSRLSMTATQILLLIHAALKSVASSVTLVLVKEELLPWLIVVTFLLGIWRVNLQHFPRPLAWQKEVVLLKLLVLKKCAPILLWSIQKVTLMKKDPLLDQV